MATNVKIPATSAYVLPFEFEMILLAIKHAVTVVRYGTSHIPINIVKSYRKRFTETQKYDLLVLLLDVQKNGGIGNIADNFQWNKFIAWLNEASYYEARTDTDETFTFMEANNRVYSVVMYEASPTAEMFVNPKILKRC